MLVLVRVGVVAATMLAVFVVALKMVVTKNGVALAVIVTGDSTIMSNTSSSCSSSRLSNSRPQQVSRF